MQPKRIQPTDKSKFVKIFVDGQNFYNRLDDNGLGIVDFDFRSFFYDILNKIIIQEENSDIYISKVEWYVTGPNFVDQIPWKDLRKKTFSPHFDSFNDPMLKQLIGLNSNDPRMPDQYRKILQNNLGRIKNIFKKRIKKIKQNFIELEDTLMSDNVGIIHPSDGKKLDMIYIKKSGFLKIDYINETLSEKGVDVAIASQMLASILPTDELQAIDDPEDIIPDYNSDIIVLVSSDMDFVEPIKMLHKMKKPVYMVHVQDHHPSNIPTKNFCKQLVYPHKEIRTFRKEDT